MLGDFRQISSCAVLMAHDGYGSNSLVNQHPSILKHVLVFIFDLFFFFLDLGGKRGGGREGLIFVYLLICVCPPSTGMKLT